MALGNKKSRLFRII